MPGHTSASSHRPSPIGRFRPTGWPLHRSAKLISGFWVLCYSSTLLRPWGSVSRRCFAAPVRSPGGVRAVAKEPGASRLPRRGSSGALQLDGQGGGSPAADALLTQHVNYKQTASKALLPEGEEALERYMQRSASQLLHDIADGYNVKLKPGQPRMLVGDVQLDAGLHTISYPEGDWSAPYGLGHVEVAGPQLDVHLVDVAGPEEQPPQSVPQQWDSDPKWHRGRALAVARLTNGNDLLRVALTLPLVPALRFNVTVLANFTMELGFASCGEDDSQVTVGLDGIFGLSVPTFPGARKLMSLFLPGYCRKSMQQAADGTAETFKQLFGLKGSEE